MHNEILNIHTLSNYIKKLSNFPIYSIDCFQNKHLGEILANTILQAGLNYETVVKPRLKRIRNLYPEMFNISSCWHAIEKDGSKYILLWKHDEKPKRFEDLVRFFKDQKIDNVNELKEYLEKPNHHPDILKIKGIGKKTLDYLSMLVGVSFAGVAVDRHIKEFLNEAGICENNYDKIKIMIETTADALNIRRCELDHAIWKYQSTKQLSGQGRRVPLSQKKAVSVAGPASNLKVLQCALPFNTSTVLV